MARPQKEGMDYFPHDVDAVNDEKIEALRSLYGNDGYAFYFILLERIYRTKYFELDISDAETIQILSRKIGISADMFDKMLSTSIKHGAFCREEYEKRSVLTSNGIKKRANVVLSKREAMKDRYTTKVSGIVSAAETPQKTEEETPQSKGKIKERESKEKTDIADVIAFHATLKNLPQAKKITDLRKGHISARIKEYGVEEVKATLVMANESKYLTDSKSTNWYCYDWIYNPTNFAKIAEGKYAAKFDSKQKPPCAGIIPASNKPIPILPKWENEIETTEYFYNPQWGDKEDDDDEVM